MVALLIFHKKERIILLRQSFLRPLQVYWPQIIQKLFVYENFLKYQKKGCPSIVYGSSMPFWVGAYCFLLIISFAESFVTSRSPYARSHVVPRTRMLAAAQNITLGAVGSGRDERKGLFVYSPRMEMMGRAAQASILAVALLYGDILDMPRRH